MMRRPRQHSEKHLAFIRQLPCVACKNDQTVDAAHIRYAAEPLGKRHTGKGEKPDDKWTVPLCRVCHREQHGTSERFFWDGTNIDPIVIALALWAHTGQHDIGEKIARAA